MSKQKPAAKKNKPAKKDEKITFLETPYDANLKVALNSDEVMIQAEIMARLQTEIKAKEDEASSVSKRYKSEIEGLISAQDRAAGLVRDKFEYRPVRCLRLLDWKNGVVIETRTDTGEIINTRPMLEAETQMQMRLEDEKKEKEAKAKEEKPGENKQEQPEAGPANIPLEPITEEEVNQAEIIIGNTGRASVASISRKMKINTAKASRIMDMLETRGVVGPAKEDGGPRDILKDPNTMTSGE